MESKNLEKISAVSPFDGDKVAEKSNNISARLRVYKKKSTFKGAKEEDFWYSATRSDGSAVSCIFKCPVTTESKAFEISNVIGNLKRKEVVAKGETYINYTYYINSCDFHEIEGEELPL